MGYYSVIKNNKILPFATTWMDPQNIRLSKVGQRKTILYDITYMCNLKSIKTNVYRKTEIDSQKKNQ